jgi:hypothetical protein
MSTSDPSAEPAQATVAGRGSGAGALVRVLRVLFTAVAVVGLAVDAYVHFDLAANYDAIKTSTLSQGDLFRVEAVAAVLAALVLLIRPRRYTALFAFLVAAGGLAAVLVYRYYNIKGFGPFPAMYEPVWYTEKTQSAYAEAAAALAGAALLAMPHTTTSRRDTPANPGPVASSRRSSPAPE